MRHHDRAAGITTRIRGSDRIERFEFRVDLRRCRILREVRRGFTLEGEGELRFRERSQREKIEALRLKCPGGHVATGYLDSGEGLVAGNRLEDVQVALAGSEFEDVQRDLAGDCFDDGRCGERAFGEFGNVKAVLFFAGEFHAITADLPSDDIGGGVSNERAIGDVDASGVHDAWNRVELGFDLLARGVARDEIGGVGAKGEGERTVLRKGSVTGNEDIIVVQENPADGVGQLRYLRAPGDDGRDAVRIDRRHAAARTVPAAACGLPTRACKQSPHCGKAEVLAGAHADIVVLNRDAGDAATPPAGGRGIPAIPSRDAAEIRKWIDVRDSDHRHAAAVGALGAADRVAGVARLDREQHIGAAAERKDDIRNGTASSRLQRGAAADAAGERGAGAITGTDRPEDIADRATPARELSIRRTVARRDDDIARGRRRQRVSRAAIGDAADAAPRATMAAVPRLNRQRGRGAQARELCASET